MLSDFLFYKAIFPASGGGSGGGWNVIHHTRESIAGLPSVDTGVVVFKVSDDAPTIEQLKQCWFGCHALNNYISLFSGDSEDFIVEQGDFTAIPTAPTADTLGAIIAYKDIPELGLSTGIYFSGSAVSGGEAILIYPV
jgi:hypothetical protein